MFILSFLTKKMMWSWQNIWIEIVVSNVGIGIETWFVKSTQTKVHIELKTIVFDP